MVASDTSVTFYNLFNTFSTLAIIVGVVVLGLMAYLVIRFRAKDSSPEPEDSPRLGRLPEARGHLKTVIISVTLSSIVLGVLIFGTFIAADALTTIPAKCSQIPGECLTIRVTAYRFGWNFTYPNQQTLIGNLTIPVGRTVVLEIVSRSERPGFSAVFHSFGIESFKIKKDAIPGRANAISFEAKEVGFVLNDIRCFELCGTGHAKMTANLNSVSPESFQGFCSSSGC